MPRRRRAADPSAVVESTTPRSIARLCATPGCGARLPLDVDVLRCPNGHALAGGASTVAVRARGAGVELVLGPGYVTRARRK